MRAYTPKVGRHVTYITSVGRRRPATITQVLSKTLLNLRIGRRGGVFNNVPRQNNQNQTGVWANTAIRIIGAPAADRILRTHTGEPIQDHLGRPIEVLT